MAENDRQPTQSDQLLATIRFAILAVLIGTGLFYFGPPLVQQWQEFQKAEAERRKLHEEESKRHESVVSRRTISEFSLGRRQEGAEKNGYLEVTNNSSTTLTDVQVTLLLVSDDNTNTELNRTWSTWDPGEKKKIGLGTIKDAAGCGLRGTARIREEEVLLRGVFTFERDAIGFNQLEVRISKALLSSNDSIYITNKTGSVLTDVTLNLHVTYEPSKTHDVSRSYPTWAAGQQMTITVPHHGSIQKLTWKGATQVGGVRKSISFESGTN